MTRDLGIARCWWECRPGYHLAVRDQLDALKKRLRYLVQERLQIRYAPKLEWHQIQNLIINQDSERLLDQISDEMQKDFVVSEDVQQKLTCEEKNFIFQQILQDFAEKENQFGHLSHRPIKKQEKGEVDGDE
eukprot:TRINITY_DN16664_c0_g1_i1.p3 TRINITY_DN16664_c0_g1~~TRINITY_DN16664_c0_g1_i1.p3  ORF type:complete len:132 (+),score=43.99 TRINITY_DN16664_c0_g1_i1:673-1068(+)